VTGSAAVAVVIVLFGGAAHPADAETGPPTFLEAVSEVTTARAAPEQRSRANGAVAVPEDRTDRCDAAPSAP